MLKHTNPTHQWSLYVKKPDGERVNVGRYNAYEDAEAEYEKRRQDAKDGEEYIIELEDDSPGG